MHSDLFSNIKGKFNTIIFNPPYLPEDEFKDKSLDGGKKGYEIIEKFLNKVSKIRLIVSTQPKLSGIGKKKPEVFEVEIGGNEIKEKFEVLDQDRRNRPDKSVPYQL